MLDEIALRAPGLTVTAGRQRIALDDERNIHRAAEVLCMTQPAASKQLKDLEDMLDVKLFDRHPRGMEPTPFAAQLAEPVAYALGLLHSALNQRASFDPATSTRTLPLRTLAMVRLRCD